MNYKVIKAENKDGNRDSWSNIWEQAAFLIQFRERNWEFRSKKINEAQKMKEESSHVI